MSKKTREMKLTTFVKEACANFGLRYQLCSDDEPCKVLNGDRCGYFEKKVLGPPDYKYRIPKWDYQKLFAQYAQLTGAETRKVNQRRCKCGCGKPVRPRHRFSDDCSKQRARESSKRRTKYASAVVEKASETPQNRRTGETDKILQAVKGQTKWEFA